MNNFDSYLHSSIGRKQIVAVTGLMLILFIIGHLLGNLFIYLGPEAFNAYAKKLAGLRPGLYFVEVGLLIVFVIHMWVTTLLVLENIRSRPVGYKVQKSAGNRSWATRLMPFTGTIILAFVIWHLIDFTFVDKHGPSSVLSDGNSYGLYGVVCNAFKNPLHSGFYIIAIMCLGLHLSHGVQSFMQTFGFNHPRYTPVIKKLSNGFSVAMVVGYCSIPVYVLMNAQIF